MKLRIIAGFLLALSLVPIFTISSSNAQNPTTQKAKTKKPVVDFTPSGIAKKYLDDDKFVKENYYYRTKTQEFVMKYRTDDVTKEIVREYEHMFYYNSRRRWIPEGEKPNGGWEPEKGLKAEASWMDNFEFISREHYEDEKYSVITFKATESSTRKIKIPLKVLFFNIDVDITDVINAMTGNIEVWDNGKIKAFQAHLPQKTKLNPSTGSAELELLDVKLETQLVDNLTVFKRVEIHYKAKGGFAIFNRSEHKKIIIEYYGYKKMTLFEKGNYFRETNSFGKVRKADE